MKTARGVIGALMLATVACATAGSGLFGEEGRGEEPDLRSRLNRALEILADGTVAPGKAVETALGAEKGTALEVELAVVRKEEADHLVWEVEILTGKALRKVCVDVRKGDVVDDRPDEDEAEYAELTKFLVGRHVDLGRALGALGDAGLIAEMELESEDGELRFEAKVVHDGRILERSVEVESGRVRSEDDDEDEDED